MSQLVSAPPAALVGVGLCTPLGLTARRTQCELAAGTLRYRETAELTLGDEPVRAARLTVLPETATRQERAQALATTALQEVLLGVPGNLSRAIPLFLAGPSLPLDTRALLAELRAVARASNHELRCEPGWLFDGGRAAGFQALAAALALLAREPLVLVGGVDSLCDPETLRRLACRNRILSRSNPDGSLPGEGSGFLLISAFGACPPGITPRAALLGVTLAHEPHGYAATTPSNADGLTTALRALREHALCGGRRVDLLVHCQTAETFWAKELSRAYLRNAALCPEPFKPLAIAASTGDLGGAAGIVATAIAVCALAEVQPEYPLRRRALVYGCSDDGPVGACVIEALA